jgi:hypothetical protein
VVLVGRQVRKHREEPRVAEAKVNAEHVAREALIGAAAVEATLFPRRQNAGQHVEDVGVLVEGGRRLEPHEDRSELAVLPDRHAPRAALLRLGGGHLRNLVRSGVDLPESLGHLREHLGAIKLPHDRERRVVGPVEGVVVLSEAVGRDRFDVALPSNRGMVVRMGDERRAPHLIEQPRDRVILIAVPLVEDDRPLILDVAGVEQRPPHPVRLHVEREGEVLGRQHLVVVGAIEPGRRVDLRPHALKGPEDRGPFPLVVALRAFKHEVLQHVGGAGVARALVAAPHVVSHHRRSHRRPVLRQEEDAEVILSKAVTFDAVRRLLKLDGGGNVVRWGGGGFGHAWMGSGEELRLIEER